MSNLAVEWAETFPVKDTYERIILMKLARHADNDGTDTWPSITTLAKCAMCDTETVRRRLRSLQQRRVLARGDQSRVAHHHPGQRSVVYDLLIPRSWYSDAQWEKIQEERVSAGEKPIDPAKRPDIQAPEQRGRAKRSDIGIPNPKRKKKPQLNPALPLTEETPLTEGGGDPPLTDVRPPSNKGEHPPLTDVSPPSNRGANPSFNPSKESLQEPPPQRPPQESNGDDLVADENDGGGGQITLTHSSLDKTDDTSLPTGEAGGEIDPQVLDMLVNIPIPAGKRRPGRRSPKLLAVAERCTQLVADPDSGLSLDVLRSHLGVGLESAHSIASTWLWRLSANELPDPSAGDPRMTVAGGYRRTKIPVDQSEYDDWRI